MWQGLGRYGYGVGHMAPWFAWVGPIVMILFWALVVAAIVFFIRYIVRKSRSSSNGDSAMGILRERYARGELSKEEFETRRKDLQ
jgi:putative membrane protein